MKIFRQLAVLSPEASLTLALLEMGLDGQDCKSVTVRTSPKAMTISLDGRRLCSGKNAAECIANFKKMRAEAAQNLRATR